MLRDGYMAHLIFSDEIYLILSLTNKQTNKTNSNQIALGTDPTFSGTKPCFWIPFNQPSLLDVAS